MLKRPDIPHACASCGTAVTAGEKECRHCNAYAALGVLNDVTQRLLPNPRERGRAGAGYGGGGCDVSTTAAHSPDGIDR